MGSPAHSRNGIEVQMMGTVTPVPSCLITSPPHRMMACHRNTTSRSALLSTKQALRAPLSSRAHKADRTTPRQAPGGLRSHRDQTAELSVHISPSSVLKSVLRRRDRRQPLAGTGQDLQTLGDHYDLKRTTRHHPKSYALLNGVSNVRVFSVRAEVKTNSAPV